MGDWLTGLALGAPGSVYVAGNSNSYKNSYKNSDGHFKVDRYPVTANAFQLKNPGAASECECYDAVASKLSGL